MTQDKNKEYLFLFTIGPVQSFIAQARKTQDLYAGSQLLADLVHCGLSWMKATGEENTQIIYPSYAVEESKKSQEMAILFSCNLMTNTNSYPNRIVAVVTAADDEAMLKYGARLEKIMRLSFSATAREHFDKIDGVKNTNNLRDSMFAQIDNLLEVYWVAVPYYENNYQACFKELESQMGSIKNFRQIKQLEETGRKCNVDGQYNVKVYRKSAEEADIKRVRDKKLFSEENYMVQQNDEILYRHIQPGEGLSAVSFFKRLYRCKKNEDQTFPSTASIALMNVLENNEIKNLITKYKKNFLDISYDDQLLFEDNLNKDYFDKYEITDKEKTSLVQELPRLSKELNAIKNKAKDLGLPYSKQYALLRFDGDSMGKKLAKAASVKQHQDFSQLLIDFAKKATYVIDGDCNKERFSSLLENEANENKLWLKKLTEKRIGRTVYAGGDDFLGFVNIDSLFETMQLLQDLFRTEVSDKAKGILEIEEDFTFSAGVVIAHYKTPLKEVIRKSKELEDQAKKYRDDRKNNSAICYMTSSNTLAETIIYNEDWKTLEILTNALKNGDVSKKFIYSFVRTMEGIAGELEEGSFSTMLNLQRIELDRLLKRATTGNVFLYKSTNERVVDNKLNERLKKLLDNNANKKTIDNQNYAGFLKVAEKIASNLHTNEND
mgnify:CR=1 FL=1